MDVFFLSPWCIGKHTQARHFTPTFKRLNRSRDERAECQAESKAPETQEKRPEQAPCNF